MFKLAPNASFTYPVKVETITNGGAVRKDTFTVTFKRLSTSEVTDWITRFTDSSRESPEAAIQTARELAHAVVQDWSDITSLDGSPLSFSTDALSQALDVHPVPTAIASAWLEAVNGGAKRKNL